ncbi:MAG TPA: ABC transporter ATP-binding protein, partial [Candidatus Rifleibacterium sp.]|nr:ABC transporter ATP-binding protein [Candidatus Rifleibacterium sp.]
MLPIEVENLCFAYHPQKPVLHDVSFTIQPGSVTSILGPNGSGKTTLLKLLLGLQQPGSGSIKVCGRDMQQITLAERARRMAYVPQQHNAVFAFRSEDVVAMGRLPDSGLFCRISSSDRQMAQQNMKKLGILHLAECPYTEISGGEQQLVLLARALTQGAEILILD